MKKAHLSSGASFLQANVKKPAHLAARGLNPILRGDELEGEDLQNIHAPPMPPPFLHAVTSTPDFYQPIRRFGGNGNFLLPPSALCQR
ncbi:hypothetical protein [Herbaspirillum sp.]|uniref:hypothetical protein n=1 Tax=Herbaspirillum sp. TaxID=1890675 RepID=UPI001B09CD8A|nr:hypothetical protein [Herbaspirillum sp.]MBO9536435.1 hypothetical protein [Herbaspirillum sp.]